MRLQGRRPRDHYGPRRLLPGHDGYIVRNRAYDKKIGDPRGVEAIPAEWAVVCPNRIAERRRAAGYADTMGLARSMDSISYQRLKRMEIGRVIIRESEYELVADHLGIPTDDLKLPLLTADETREWNERWGPQKKIEEGGDHDSVLLAAYVRLLIEQTGSNRLRVAKSLKLAGNVLSFIWYAEKPIDRYPDSTMGAVIMLSGLANWDEVVMESRSLYDQGMLTRHIEDIQQPRTRYAPEDPDRRSPWSFESDPLRVRERRRAVKTPLSAVPLAQTRTVMAKQERRDAKRRRLEEIRAKVQSTIDIARTASVDMLRDLHPDTPVSITDMKDMDIGLIRTLIARTLVVRRMTKYSEMKIASEMLGISQERLRQLSIADRSGKGLSKMSLQTKRIAN